MTRRFWPDSDHESSRPAGAAVPELPETTSDSPRGPGRLRGVGTVMIKDEERDGYGFQKKMERTARGRLGCPCRGLRGAYCCWLDVESSTWSWRSRGVKSKAGGVVKSWDQIAIARELRRCGSTNTNAFSSNDRDLLACPQTPRAKPVLDLLKPAWFSSTSHH